MTTAKKHIVLLTNWYPPLRGVAVNRMNAFVKYLDHSKFKVTVVTLGDSRHHGKAEENAVTVYRVKPPSGIVSPKFRSSDSRLWHYTKVTWRKALIKLRGDENEFWVKKAVAILQEVDAVNKIDLLISSFSPAAPHLAGIAFCKTKRVPWIVDMRDEMSQNPQSDSAARKYYARIEAEIATYATALTSVSQPIVDYFKEVIPGLKAYVEIRNGFDHEMEERSYTFGNEFTLLHAGTFYGTRKPVALMAALENLHVAGQMPAGWKFICAGAARNFNIPDSIKTHVVLKDPVGPDEIIEIMRSADLNVLVQPPTGRKGIYTGKLFDYLSVQKPILAVVDKEDVAAELIERTRCGYVSDFSDVKEIEKKLRIAVDHWKRKVPIHPDIPVIRQLHRKYEVQKLNLLIEKLLGEN